MEKLTAMEKQAIQKRIEEEFENINKLLEQKEIYLCSQYVMRKIESSLIIVRKNLEEILKDIPQYVYEYVGKKEINKVLNCKVDYSSNIFIVGLSVSTKPYDENYFETKQEKMLLKGYSYDNLLFLFEKYPLMFIDCIFDYNIFETIYQLKQIQKLSFLNCIFKNNLYLNFQECLDIFQMDNCVFERQCKIKGTFKDNVYFNNSHFKDNVYFNNSHFKDNVYFHECEFEKTACFYGVTFDKAPNFSQAIFKGNLNAVNTNLNFTFDDLQEKIKQEYEDFNKGKNKQDEKPLDEFANDFRDSFRTFKSALIKDNNLLDASNFHKYELYCKEIELKEYWNKINKTNSKKDAIKNQNVFKNFIDSYLLNFYRKLCDHHTDFLRVFNNFLLLISLHILYSSFILYINDKKIVDDAKIYLSDIFNYNNIFLYVSGILFFICVCSIYFCKNKEKTHMINEEIKVKKIEWGKIIIKEIYTSFLVLSTCCLGTFVFGMIGDFLAKFFDLKIFKDILYISFVCLSFIGLFLFFIHSFVLRYIFVSCSYFIVAFVLFLKPKEFYFIYDIFKDSSENLTIMNSLNVIYFVLIILVIFSLQKTARKNSIVPS
ncbi:hypothetical protein FVD15_04055 [Campylobacter volucris]|uniref:Pentapeptide repeat-containing protein n=1 Tax=Campylobacter volucris TaxID=1031542 RepID=A0AAE5YIP2_9BACT|nr:pentapeptide repeat-containing protein [Campylobacter volucris]AJC94739.1 putative membrane protein [Campylobacter volucris LMG 24379]KAB0579366.1 hypothetical protein F7P61_04405 [Campylobacter volucris]QBL12918.1 hypothetical protein A9460_00690 [Campylobacter volucris]QEL08956.1 putative membrane protein [Campylobacter volucris]TXK68955.1 hypothetical protein FVD15_04055 [Campylobacter volucris]